MKRTWLVRSVGCFAMLAATAIVALAGRANAATIASWTVASGNWTVAANWSTNPTVPSLATDIADYTITTAASATTVDANETVGEIRYGGATGASMGAGTTRNWTIGLGSNTLTLDNSGLANSFGTNGALIQAWNSAPTANNNGQLILSGGTLQLNDNLTVVNKTITSGSTTVAPLQISSLIQGNKNVTFSNLAPFPTQFSGTSGNRNAISISGVNTFTGNVAVTSGLVVYNNASAFGNAANIITLDPAGTGTAAGITMQVAVNVPYNIVVPAGAAGATIGSQVATAANGGTYSGNISIGGTSATTTLNISSLSGTAIAPAATDVGLTISGVISGDGNILKTGGASNEGSLTLGNANTYTGLTIINRGQIRVTSLNSVVGGTSSSSLGVPTAATAKIILIGAAGSTASLVYTGAGETTDRGLDIQSSVAAPTFLYSSGTGPLVLSSGIDSSAGAVAKPFNLSGTNTGDNAVNGNITNTVGTLALTKAGVGKWILGGAANSYSGATAVNGGTLLVNGTNSGGGQFTVASGAILGGTGSVGASAITVNSGGALAPGASIESLLGGATTFNGTATFSYELDTTAINADLLVVDGALSIAPTSTLSLSDLAPGVAALNTKFTLINYSGALTGEFSGFADDSTFTLGSNMWKINYNDISGGANFNIDQTKSNFVTITAVPEPYAAVLAWIGVVGCALVGRRRVK